MIKVVLFLFLVCTVYAGLPSESCQNVGGTCVSNVENCLGNHIISNSCEGNEFCCLSKTCAGPENSIGGVCASPSDIDGCKSRLNEYDGTCAMYTVCCSGLWECESDEDCNWCRECNSEGLCVPGENPSPGNVKESPCGTEGICPKQCPPSPSPTPSPSPSPMCVEDEDCDDNNLCTYDNCDSEDNDCMNEPVDCDDENPCTEDTCEPEIGCVHTPIHSPECACDGKCKLEAACDGMPIPGFCENENYICCGRGCTDNSECKDDDPCTTHVCDQGSGDCRLTGNFCEDCADRGGICEENGCGNANEIGLCGDAGSCCRDCENEADCDDDINCTTDSCEVDGECLNVNNCPDVEECPGTCNIDSGECEYDCPSPSPTPTPTNCALTFVGTCISSGSQCDGALVLLPRLCPDDFVCCITSPSPTPSIDCDCTHTQGYWGNHNCHADENSQDISWPLHPLDGEDYNLGVNRTSECATEDSILACDITMYDLILGNYNDTNFSGGNNFKNLAFQLVAAILNVFEGADTPQSILNDIDEGILLLEIMCVGDANGWEEADNVKTRLDNYNNGWGIDEPADDGEGPNHCEEKHGQIGCDGSSPGFGNSRNSEADSSKESFNPLAFGLIIGGIALVATPFTVYFVRKYRSRGDYTRIV